MYDLYPDSWGPAAHDPENPRSAENTALRRELLGEEVVLHADEGGRVGDVREEAQAQLGGGALVGLGRGRALDPRAC